MQSTKWVNGCYKSIESQGHSLTLGQGHSDFKIQTCFSQKPLGHLKPNFVWKLVGERKWKFILISLVTWPRWLPWQYMVKTLQKSSYLEPVGRLPWNLVCSIGDSGPIIISSNDDSGLALTYFMPRSNLITYAFVWKN